MPNPGRGQGMEDHLAGLLARDPTNVLAARWRQRLRACETPEAKDAEADRIVAEFRQWLQAINAIMQRMADHLRPRLAQIGRAFLRAAGEEG